MSTQQTSQDNPLAGFGPNEWIVEDMYQRYLADPASVDPAWHDFFADYRPSSSAQPRRRPPPAPPRRPPAAPRRAGAGRDAGGRRGRTARRRPPRRPRPRRPPADEPAGPRHAGPAGAHTTPIRGVAARIVQNMDASLQVPTATSVRAVPAKLIADNRIVINNHLARGRGGKVSFTHLIGYALVEALAAHPEMNNSFAEVDGKPVAGHAGRTSTSASPSTWPSRTARAPSWCRASRPPSTMDFRQFWQAYEDVVRRARRNELTMDDYAGTTISLTNPGGIGTVHSHAAAA